MANKYVLLHGGIRTPDGMLMPSDKPEKPTVLELEPEEAAKLGKHGELQLLTEYEAGRAGDKAGAAAKEKSLKEAAAAKEAAEKAAAAKADKKP